MDIIKKGRRQEDRTGTGTISLFGDVQSIYYMEDGFPSLGLKYNWWKGIYHELLWFLDAVPEEYKKFGNTNIKYLVDHGVGIWNEWPHKSFNELELKIWEQTKSNVLYPEDFPEFKPTSLEDFVEKIKSDDNFALEHGNLGPVYGKQWMDWGGEGSYEDGYSPGKVSFKEGINQIQTAIDKINNNPNDRGNIVSAWNVALLDRMALRPCHTMFQLKSEPLTRKERFSLFNEKASNEMLEWRFKTIDEVTDEEMNSPAFNIPKRRLSLKIVSTFSRLLLRGPI